MASSSSLLDKARYSWAREKAKFQYMGNAKYFSLLMLISMFTLFPAFLRSFWPYIQDSLPKVPFYLIITYVIAFVAVGFYTLAMYFIYTLKIPFFEQYRCDPNLKWQWERNPKEWQPFRNETIKTVLINAFVINSVLLFVDSSIRMDIKFKTQDEPDTFTLIWQFFFFLLVQEFTFYVFHRTLHHHKLYFLHKKHHEYKATINLTYLYSGTIENLGNTITTGISYTLLSRVYPVHIFAVIIWMTYRIIETEDGHCGYDWPWAVSHWFPFSAGGKYHFFHHSKNAGNFGAVLHIFDTLFDTNLDYRKVDCPQRYIKGGNIEKTS